MGLIWKSAMPLLTTLAALVIIVHCIEEDLEADYQHEIRPRMLDRGIVTDEKAWRALEDQKSRNVKENWDIGSPETSPKRRRPGRKRKRRPQTEDTEILLPQEKFSYNEEPPRPYYDFDNENIRQTTETPKRRRKKPEARPIRWTDDEVMVVERPLRKNSGRRKQRPPLQGLPALSDFRDTNLNQEKIEAEPETKPHELIAERVFGYNREPMEDRKSDTDERYKPLKELNEKDHVEPPNEPPLPADRSLSEFSMELLPKKVNAKDDYPHFEVNMPKTSEPEYGVSHRHETENYEDYSFLNDKRTRLPKRKKKKNREEEREKDKAKEKMDMYPSNQLSLKDILKRSNGTSLSEILQQHNLSLADLLHGKEHAVSVLNSNNVMSTKSTEKNITGTDIKDESEEPISFNLPDAIPTAEQLTTTEAIQTEVETDTVPPTTAKPIKDPVPMISTSRRYPVTLRKKLRIRPINNTTNPVKGQLSRDLITLNARRYSNFRRNVTKSRQWKEILPTFSRNNTKVENNNNTIFEKTTTELVVEETTLSNEVASQNSSYEDTQSLRTTNIKLDDINMDEAELTTTESMAETTQNCTEKTVGIVSMPRPTAISPGLRQQALNNRLKKKRLKNKNSTTEAPQDDIIKHLFGMNNLVSSSEFIARTQGPKVAEDNTEFSTLEDFMTTEPPAKTSNTRVTSVQTTTPQPLLETTTAQTAKVEINEIFSDTKTREKLSRILKERNMTLNELVELRERGSSHIHLADIFHNASKEPNPAEPFLSKSLLEPISKETYPLRAILEANSHETTGRVSTIGPHINIPVVMDFGNNVNENAENMGIMSLFNHLPKNITQRKASIDTEKRNITVNTDASVTTTTHPTRESRVLDNEDDVISWNEIFSLMGRSNDEIEEASTGPPVNTATIEDADGDGLIGLEDLEHLTDFNNRLASAFKEHIERPNKVETATGILETIPSHTKSVTVATASIAGLAMVLFLLTYATYKWKQQKSMMRKPSFDDRIPAPVFEHRKGHKNNCSTRSISPMLQTSNIYTLNTLDSQNGKDSPDYMWDSLRKPFQ